MFEKFIEHENKVIFLITSLCRQICHEIARNLQKIVWYAKKQWKVKICHQKNHFYFSIKCPLNYSAIMECVIILIVEWHYILYLALSNLTGWRKNSANCSLWISDESHILLQFFFILQIWCNTVYHCKIKRYVYILTDSLKSVANRFHDLIMERHFSIDQWQICKIH